MPILLRIYFFAIPELKDRGKTRVGFYQKERSVSKRLFIAIIYLFGIVITSHLWAIPAAIADEVAITALSTTPTGFPQANVPVTITASAAGSAGQTIYYKFYYCANYGTSNYLSTPWTVVQDYSTSNRAVYTFPAAGDYIVVVRAVTDPNNEPSALPIVGKAITVGSGGKVNIIGLSSNANTSVNAGQAVTYTVTASSASGETIYYQFYYCANYGTRYYGSTSWTLVQAYSTTNSCQYVFPSDGNYVVVARAVTDPQNEPAALPIIGTAVSIGNPDVNHKPVASDITLHVSSTVPYIQQQLVGSDPDDDTILYELVSNSSGSGYSLAYVNNSTGMLYVTPQLDGTDSFSLSYRVTDGQLYSGSAKVNISISYYEDDQNTGRIDVSPEQYARFQLSTYNSDLLGAVGAAPSQPRSVDLSSNFPVPGDQGRQSSCVGWATAFALKSYQEKVEMGWSLNTSAHLFSPSFLYNQINGGQDRGSYIYEALDLAVNKGLATLSLMPYSDTDYRTQPSAAALAEAAKYKAASWDRVNDTSQIKAALVNRKPVVAGIKVYQQLMNLSGSNSVYNTATGENQGGHAVTIVGYDDDRYGGAFKVINSWSQNWGDGGYFWMPYSFAAQGILSEAYVLVDAENGQVTPQPEDPTEPEPNVNTLPNLTVESWNASYDPRPRGTGTLTYSVVNNGVGTAYAGADINLMLSRNAEITAYDYYVIYETIPFDLASGESVYRDSGNSISFQFPDQLEPGTYYMALWVDDLDQVTESNENDNVLKGSNVITITNSLPDLSVNTWYAEWNQYGYGTLTYEVINSGNSGTTTLDWYINLILDRDQVIDNGNEIFLFYEQTNYYLDPGEYVYRDESSAATFNLYVDYMGFSVPSGTYYMALWVDDLNAENESNELNNGSYSWGTVPINRGGLSISNLGISNADGNVTTDNSVSDAENQLIGKAYNGKKLPAKNVIKRKVKIARTESGALSMTFTDQENTAMKIGEQQTQLTKTISSCASVIFPSTNKTAMPGREGSHGK